MNVQKDALNIFKQKGTTNKLGKENSITKSGSLSNKMIKLTNFQSNKSTAVPKSDLHSVRSLLKPMSKITDYSICEQPSILELKMPPQINKPLQNHKEVFATPRFTQSYNFLNHKTDLTNSENPTETARPKVMRTFARKFPNISISSINSYENFGNNCTSIDEISIQVLDPRYPALNKLKESHAEIDALASENLKSRKRRTFVIMDKLVKQVAKSAPVLKVSPILEKD